MYDVFSSGFVKEKLLFYVFIDVIVKDWNKYDMVVIVVMVLRLSVYFFIIGFCGMSKYSLYDKFV